MRHCEISIALFALALASCGRSPESWSPEFAANMTACGVANSTSPGDGFAVTTCIESAIHAQRPFSAGVDLTPIRFVDGRDIVRGRVIGIDVNGTYELFAESGGDWWGPCVTFDRGGGAGSVWCACYETRLPSAPSRSYMEVPSADVGRVPWE